MHPPSRVNKQGQGELVAMQNSQIQGYSYQDRQGLLPVLATTLAHCGGCVRGRKMLSPTTLAIEVKIELIAVLDLYAGIISAGLELTRAAHLTLTELCLRRQHIHLVDAGQVVTIQLEISFLQPDGTLSTLEPRPCAA